MPRRSRCPTAAQASLVPCVSPAQGVLVECAQAMGSAKTDSWAMGNVAAKRGSMGQPVRCVSWVAMAPPALEYVTVTMGCARRGCAGMEAVSVMRAGRVSAVTRKSLIINVPRSAIPMPTASRTLLESLPASVLQDTRATAAIAQRWIPVPLAMGAAHPMPTVPRWLLGSGHAPARMATRAMESYARK